MSAPRISLRVDDVQAQDAAWRVRWSVRNEGDLPLRVYRAQAPHGRFRAGERRLEVELEPGKHGLVELDVAADVSWGNDVENAFLILEASAGGVNGWRVLARMRARVDDAGSPQVLIERIDVQEVGFSGSA
ncbi:MAG TPA: hypothetical protein VFM93_01215 [Candidatus Limnocylindria bacterium]|nr:hypothetical protein [Candidatus Limnocylindria bacterium]